MIVHVLCISLKSHNVSFFDIADLVLFNILMVAYISSGFADFFGF